LHTAEDIHAVLAGKDLSDQYKIGHCEAKISDLVVLLRLVLGDHKETKKEERLQVRLGSYEQENVEVDMASGAAPACLPVLQGVEAVLWRGKLRLCKLGIHSPRRRKRKRASGLSWQERRG